MFGMRMSGNRVPIAIDLSLLIAGIITATLLYADVTRLKSYADDVSEARITRLETDIEYIKDAQDKTAAEIKSLRTQIESNRREILDAIRQLGQSE